MPLPDDDACMQRLAQFIGMADMILALLYAARSGRQPDSQFIELGLAAVAGVA